MKWKLQKPSKFKVSLYKKVFEDIGLSQTMAKILINRNIGMQTALQLLKNPTELFEEPRKIFGAELVAKEILKNLNQGKKFYIYANYDIDGMTSGYIDTEYLRSLGERVEVIFPQRSDGYGINLKFCEKVAEDKNAVVMTVDNGITKIDEIKFLNGRKIPVLITDHHQPAENLPECPIYDAFADKNSTEKHLCGAGIIWKVICLVDEFLKAKNYNFSKNYMSPENYAPKAEDKIIVAEIGDSTFGIAGIAAAKLVEKFNLPVCIYKKCDSEIISASVRSIEGLNILDCLKAEKIKGNIQDFG